MLQSASLLSSIRSGDNEALRSIYREYRTAFIQYIRSEFTCTEDDAIEFFQTSVVILYDNVMNGKLLELNGNVKSYLFGIGRNKAHEWLRYRHRMNATSDDLLINYLHEEAPDTDETEFTNNMRQVEQGMQRLGDPCRTLLTYFYYQKMTMHEICNRLDYKNEDTAKNQKYKCLRRLQSICAELGMTSQSIA